MVNKFLDKRGIVEKEPEPAVKGKEIEAPLDALKFECKH